MLKVKIPEREIYDEEQNLFIQIKGCSLTMEHSLLSISKWEAKYCRPFLQSEDKTNEQVLDYIRFMTLTQNVDPNTFRYLPASVLKEITEYISSPMTATTFTEREGQGRNRDIITSELIYYWMIAYQIPFECEKWHLNRLLTLIRICGIKNAPTKKMGKNEILRRNASLNAARRAASGSRG